MEEEWEEVDGEVMRDMDIALPTGDNPVIQQYFKKQ